MNINKARIEKNLKELAVFGANVGGGIDRPFGSPADGEARRYLRGYWQRELGLDARLDAIANMWVTRPGTEDFAPIVLGSHHDTVPNGGAYDGALGVLLATEVLQTVIEAGIQFRHPLAVVSFSGEEPNPYGVSTLGSKTLSGKLTKDILCKVVSQLDRTSLKSAVQDMGGDLEQLDGIKLTGKEMSAFIECHIEQGRRLFDKHLSLGIVTAITGIYREKVVITGAANHAGTTIMCDRQDALTAAAAFTLAFEALIKGFERDDVVGTIGAFNVYPNAANIIPGKVELTVEFRTSDLMISKHIIKELDRMATAVAAERQVDIARTVILDQAAVGMDKKIMDALHQSLRDSSEPSLDVVSMAGHDAAHMAEFIKTGMLFVRSIDGKSHCPEEQSDIGDIVKAGDALFKAVLILDKELN